MKFSCLIFFFFLIGQNLRPLIGEEKELCYGGEKMQNRQWTLKEQTLEFMLSLIITVCCKRDDVLLLTSLGR